GSCPPNRQGFFYQPTILTNVKPNSRIATEEVFGPVLAILDPFDNLDDVISALSKSEFGLTASIFSSNTKSINKFKRSIRAGTIWINTHNYVFPDLPFGGFKKSGIGREMGSESITSYTTTRAIISNPNF
ncbi:Phenylacetaldehyde dehydrogenase, partial [Smittium mucronatum]